MHWLYHTVKYLLVHWGYWAVIAGLLAESAGVPVPGETTLMFASFLARKSTGLHLWLIILCGIAAATAGDNLGFWIGDKLGAALIRWIKKVFHMDDQDIAAAKDLIRHHGAKTIFFARFIFGLRTVAAPLAGVLGMEWRRFVLFNFLGAATWVTCIAVSGYLFATQFQTLLDFFEKASWGLAAALFACGYLFWRRYKKKFAERSQPSQKAA